MSAAKAVAQLMAGWEHWRRHREAAMAAVSGDVDGSQRKHVLLILAKQAVAVWHHSYTLGTAACCTTCLNLWSSWRTLAHGLVRLLHKLLRTLDSERHLNLFGSCQTCCRQSLTVHKLHQCDAFLPPKSFCAINIPAGMYPTLSSLPQNLSSFMPLTVSSAPTTSSSSSYSSQS